MGTMLSELPYDTVAELIYTQPTSNLVNAGFEALRVGKPEIAEYICDVLGHEGRIEDWFEGPVMELLERHDAA